LLGRLADQPQDCLLIGMAAVAIAPFGHIVKSTAVNGDPGVPRHQYRRFTTGYSALVADIAPPKSRA